MHFSTLFQATKRSHRAWVAMPLFALLLTLSVREGCKKEGCLGRVLPGVTAEAIVTAVDSRTLLTDAGMGIVVSPASSVKVDGAAMTLESGTALIARDGLFAVTVGMFRLSGLAGGMEIVKNDASITVAAISTPVYVRFENQAMLVPVGYQWKGKSLDGAAEGLDGWLKARTLKPLPSAYLEERLKLLASLKTEAQVETVDESAPAFPALQLQASRLRAERRADREAFLGLLEAAKNDPETVRDLLATQDVSAMLASISPSDLSLLVDALAATDALLDILPSFAVQEDAWMLASFHPALWQQAWAVTGPEGATDDAALLRLFLLPMADDQAAPAGAFVVERWRQEASALLVASDDPAPLTSAFLTVMARNIAALRAKQLPQRVQAYARAAAAVALPYAEQLTDSQRALIAAWQTMEPPAPDAKPEQESSSATSASAPSVSVVIPAAVLESRTHEALVAAGALFTIRTKVEAEGGSTARVSDVVFGGKSGDAIVSFSFDPEQKVVSNIHKEGREYPYGMQWEEFVQWVKGE